jgi:hypothetical protein
MDALFTFTAITKDNKPVCINKDKWIKLEEKDSETHSIKHDKSMAYLTQTNGY